MLRGTHNQKGACARVCVPGKFGVEPFGSINTYLLTYWKNREKNHGAVRSCRWKL